MEANPIHRRLRERSLAWLDEAFGPGSHVLDIGCGVGTEAVHLARRGVTVTAADISSRMADAARARARAQGVEDAVHIVVAGARDLPGVLAGRVFDGAYASFGALNGETDLPGAIAGIAGLLRPGGDFLVSLVSRPCLSELVLGSARLHLRKAFRRLREETEIDLYGAGRVRVRTYSEEELRRALHPAFRIERLEGWLVAIPPPYAHAAWTRLGGLQRPLLWFDRRMGRMAPFRGWGDHLHVWARRRIP